MSSPRGRSAFVAVAAFLCPVGAILCVKFGFQVGPASAPAAMQPAEPLPGVARPVPVRSPAQLDADEYLASWTMPSELRSPMDHPPAQEAVERQEVLVAPAPSPAPTPALKVGSIFGTPSGGMATINGKLRRVGDEIIDGWRVEVIDVPSRSVQVKGPDGRLVTLSNRL